MINLIESTLFKTMAVNYLPKEYHNVTPYLVVPDVSKLINFLEQVFGVKQIELIPGKDGNPTHGEVRIGDSIIMIGRSSDELIQNRCITS